MKHVSPPFIAILALILLCSCEKEYSFESDGELNPPPQQTGLLISAEVEDAISKLASRYEYNVSGAILKSISTFTAGTISGNFKVEAARDGAGRLTGAKLVFSSNFSVLGDTLNYQLFRNSSGRVTSLTIKANDSGSPIEYDSVALAYNTSDKLSSCTYFFISRSGSSINIVPFQRFDFTYTGENVTQRLEYQLAGSLSSQQLIETINVQYDAEPAARVLTVEEYLLELAPVNALVPCINNPVRIEYISASDPDENFVSAYVYAYGANKKPSTAQVTNTFAVGGTTVSNMKFVYN
jgi:hypothetical protein